MSSDANLIKVVILDDDLKSPTLSISDNALKKVLNDDTSPEFEQTKEFMKASGIFESDDLDDLLSFINSHDFIEKVLYRDGFQDLFDEDYRNGILALIAEIKEKTAQLNPFLNVFSDETKFILNKRITRPENPSELAEYDVVIMDIMMGDDLDSDFPKLAKYLGEVHRTGNSPAIFLISSRDELEDRKRMFRKEAKISSLSFCIMTKTVELMSQSAETKIRLAFGQMKKSKLASEVLAKLTLHFEKAIVESADRALHTLWSLDYPYLQQMYACVDRENVSFSEHLLSVCNSILLSKLESNQELSQSLNDLKNELSSQQEKYCGFSNEAEIAMHDMEAALHFTGKSVSELNFSPSLLNNKKSEIGKVVVHTLPFGLVLLKPPYVPSKSSSFIEGAEVLINCTQQCDLSRNIIEPGTNLVFVQAVLIKSPTGNGYYLPLPTDIDNGNRWWLSIDEKRIHAKSFYEFIRYFNTTGFFAISQARDSVVRQIRERSFHNMSRIEAAVKTGHNNMFYVDLITFQSETTPTNRKQFTVNGAEKRVLLYEFPNEKNKSYHLLDQDHVEVITWLISSSKYLESKIPFERLEEILKDELPKKMDKKVAISSVNFGIQSSPNYDISTFVNKQNPVAVVFVQAEC